MSEEAERWGGIQVHKTYEVSREDLPTDGSEKYLYGWQAPEVWVVAAGPMVVGYTARIGAQAPVPILVSVWD
jgi:hypothetical protein